MRSNLELAPGAPRMTATPMTALPADNRFERAARAQDARAAELEARSPTIAARCRRMADYLRLRGEAELRPTPTGRAEG